MPPIFGSLKYKQLAILHKKLLKAKTASDILLFQKQIDFLREEIKKEENNIEDFFERL
jgi:hypothetical protein